MFEVVQKGDISMSRSYWFEIRGSASYYAFPLDEKGHTDFYKETIPQTKEQYDSYIIEKNRRAMTKGIPTTPLVEVRMKREKALLDEVDKLFCEFMGTPYDEVRYSTHFDVITAMSFSALFSLGGFSVEERHIQHIFERMKKFYTDHPGKYTEIEQIKFNALIRWALTDKWEFFATDR
jgi:hypothetical protein